MFFDSQVSTLIYELFSILLLFHYYPRLRFKFRNSIDVSSTRLDKTDRQGLQCILSPQTTSITVISQLKKNSFARGIHVFDFIIIMF